jgi:putative endonuclease
VSGARRAQGARFEALAEAHLAAHGLETVVRGFTCRHGELDLVMRDGATLVVVEVRARAASRFGDAAASVGSQKRQRIVLATRTLLAARPELARLPLRFDVVGFAIGADGAPADGQPVEWLRAAFDAA